MSFLRRLTSRLYRLLGGASISLLGLTVLPGTVANDHFGSDRPVARPHDHRGDGLRHFRYHMPRTVRSDHPAILPVAAAIRAVTTNPLEQIVMVNDVTHLLVDYDQDVRVYGQKEYHATLDEMIERRRKAGWMYLRDDCDGRALFAAHLLATLNITWRLEASYWQRHAWVIARVDGVEYDLLRLAENPAARKRWPYRLIGRHFVRRENPPPLFRWRQAWSDRTQANVEIAQHLGLLDQGAVLGHTRLRFATNWTTIDPLGKQSPFDPRTLTASSAAFPLGEVLHSD